MSQPLPAVHFAPALHRNRAVITIQFAYDKDLAARVRKLPQAAWSQTMKCRYVPDTEAYRARFKLAVKPAADETLQKLCADNEAALRLFVRELELKEYSRSTICTYRNEFLQLLQILGGCRCTPCQGSACAIILRGAMP